MIKNVKIAVVEDNNLIRDFVVDTLMFSVNREVISFENAVSAWGYFDKNDNSDIIISDVEMPGMDGLELLDRVKTQYPKKVFIVMSANPSYEKRAKELGADAFLAKPFSIEDLFSLVELYIAGKH
jgi:CheY-like chemotaxis protein